MLRCTLKHLQAHCILSNTAHTDTNGKGNMVFFYHSWSNENFQTSQSCQFSSQSFFRPSPMVMNLG